MYLLIHNSNLIYTLEFVYFEIKQNIHTVYFIYLLPTLRYPLMLKIKQTYLKLFDIVFIFLS